MEPTKNVLLLMAKYPMLERFIKRIGEEFELYKYFAEHSPKKFLDRHWLYILQTQTLETRIRYWGYMAKNEYEDEKVKQGKERNKNMQIEKIHKAEEICRAGGMGYGDGSVELLFTPRNYDVHLETQRRMASTLRRKDMPRMILDFQFIANRPVDASNRIGSQLRKMITENAVHSANPFPLSIINADKDNNSVNFIMKQLNLIHFGDTTPEKKIQREHFLAKRILPDIYPGNPFLNSGKQLIYISKHAKEMLDGPLSSDAYIIPAAFDIRGLTLPLTRSDRYRSMYFPIRKYIRWQSGPIYIPFVNMIRIFSYVSESGGDWATALRSNISLRYLRTMEERIEKMRPERFQDKMEAKAKIVHIQQLVMEAIGPASPPPKIDDLQSFLYPLRAPVHVRLPEPHSRKLKGERRS